MSTAFKISALVLGRQAIASAEKIDVNGPGEHKTWSFMKGDTVRSFDDNRADGSAEAAAGQNLAGQAIMRIPHNNEKFLISRDGQQVGRFNWADRPLAEKLMGRRLRS